MGPEGLQHSQPKAMETMGPEGLGAKNRKSAQTLGPEGLRARALKMWATRRARAAAKAMMREAAD